MTIKERLKKYIENEDGNIAKVAMYYVFCQFLLRGMAFITTPIFSRVMSPSEFGVVSNFLACESILFPIVTLNLRVTINKSKYDFRENNDAYLATILLLSNIVTIVAYVIVCLHKNFFESILSIDIKLIKLLFIYIFFYTAFDYQQIQFNIFKKYKRYVVYSITSSLISLFMSVVLVLFLEDKIIGRIIGIILPIVIIGMYIQISVYKRSKKINLFYMIYAVKRSIPLMPSALSSSILSASDKIIITNYCGESNTAMYSIAYTVSSISGILWSALKQAWGPWLFDCLDNKDFVQIKIVTRKFTLVYGLISIGLMLLAPEILLLIGGSQYFNAIDAMPPVILAMACQFFYAFYFDTEYFYGETYVISAGTMLAAFVNIILNYMFVPKYGYVAASYTTLIGYIILFLYHYLIVRIKLQKAYIFDNRYIFVTLIVLFCIQFVVLFLYQIDVMRSIMLILYLIIIIYLGRKNFDQILSLIDQIKNKKKMY